MSEHTTDRLMPELPEPFEVMELWGQNVDVYSAAQMREYARSYATALCQQGERDAKDAARYRWLRSKVGMTQTRGIGPASFVFLNMPQPTYIAPDAAIELDAAIDAALSTSEGKTE